MALIAAEEWQVKQDMETEQARKAAAKARLARVEEKLKRAEERMAARTGPRPRRGFKPRPLSAAAREKQGEGDAGGSEQAPESPASSANITAAEDKALSGPKVTEKDSETGSPAGAESEAPEAPSGDGQEGEGRQGEQDNEAKDDADKEEEREAEVKFAQAVVGRSKLMKRYGDQTLKSNKLNRAMERLEKLKRLNLPEDEEAGAEAGGKESKDHIKEPEAADEAPGAAPEDLGPGALPPPPPPRGRGRPASRKAKAAAAAGIHPPPPPPDGAPPPPPPLPPRLETHVEEEHEEHEEHEEQEPQPLPPEDSSEGPARFGPDGTPLPMSHLVAPDGTPLPGAAALPGKRPKVRRRRGKQATSRPMSAASKAAPEDLALEEAAATALVSQVPWSALAILFSRRWDNPLSPHAVCVCVCVCVCVFVPFSL